MPQAVLDEELAEGLSAAKKAPRNFALIVKGPNPVKLMVRKKKFRDAELMKTKTEAKGDDIIVGVLEASGSDFAFKVAGTAEPGVKTIKLKELIAEQTEMTAKPRWELVNELPNIGEEDNDPPQQQPPPQAPPPPPAPPPPALDAKQLLAAMNKLSPQIQAAAQANPNRKTELVQPVAAFQQHIQANELEAAKAILSQLVALLKSLPVDTTTTPQATGPLVAFQKSRLDWDSTRKAVQAELQTLEKSILDRCEGQNDFDQIAAGTKNLYKMLETLDTRLIDKLDEALNAATPNERRQKHVEALEIVEDYLDFVEDDDLISEIDDNGFTSVNIGARLTTTLNDLAKRLAV